MFGLSTLTYGLDGARVFTDSDPDTDKRNMAGGRRTTRIATLDGGAVAFDAGFAWADKTVIVSERNPAQTAVDWADWFVRTQSLGRLSMREGCFDGVPESYAVENDVLKITVLIMEKVDE